MAYDPTHSNVDDVLKKLDKADDEERERILNIERNGKARVGILSAYGIDPAERVDPTGRVLYPWEVSPENQVVMVVVEETPEQQEAREQQAELDQQDPQPAVTPAGVGEADPGVADATVTV